MTPETIRLVRDSFAKVGPLADLAAGMFYERLFTVEPGVRRLFPEDMRRQQQALMATLKFAVERLDRLDELVPVVEQLGARHVAYGVVPSHYPVVGGALLWTLEQALGPEFTPEVAGAWATTYELLATTMQSAGERARLAHSST